MVVLLTTPLQAAGEEYLFRGYLLQAVGSLFRSRWVAIVRHRHAVRARARRPELPAVLRPLRVRADRRLAGHRTGGLEAGIALHILNNFLAFGLALAFGDLGETLNVSEASAGGTSC